MLASFTKGLLEKQKKYKSKVPRCTTSLYNKRQNVTIKISVQYMALCNTVHYSYGNYMKDKVRPLQIMAKHAGQSRNFT